MVRRYPLQLLLATLLIGGLAMLPLIYIVVRAFNADPALWGRLWTGQLPGLIGNTLALVATTTLLACLIGVTAAWLVERTDLPGRNLWRWMLALPLALPGYVAAICALSVLRRGGLLDQAAMTWLGFERGQFPLPTMTSLGGATLIIALVTYPYVYLTTAAALRSIDRTLEEAAFMAGRSAWQTFCAVTLPLIAPAIAAGALLVGMYVLSDFGTVALLRYRTFTTAIYQQFAGQVDRAAAAILSLALIAFTLPLLIGEGWFHRRERRYTRSNAWRPRQLIALGRRRGLALGFIVLLLSIALLVPLLVLTGMTIQGLWFPTEVDRRWSYGAEDLWVYGLQSLLLAALAATLATGLAFAPTYLSVRYPSPATHLFLSLSKTAFALPGLIIGLGFLLFFLQALPPLYGTLAALVLGLTFRLLPKSITTGEAALQRVSPTLEQAARTMGAHPIASFWRVTLPVALPGILAGWALVFITGMKELPLMVILRPPGFDTLPIRIWEAANDSIYTQAAPAALLLILLTMIPLALLYSNRKLGIDRAMHD
jgi:iron(III) transport system permease protein